MTYKGKDGKVYNKIGTDIEYLVAGFSLKEVPLIRRHDILFNQYQKYGYLKPRKKAEMFELIERLGL